MKLKGATIPDTIVERVIARRGTEHCFADLEATRTALVVIDLQHAFMNEAVGHAVVPAASDITRLAGFSFANMMPTRDLSVAGLPVAV